MVKSSPGLNPKPRFGPILDSTGNTTLSKPLIRRNGLGMPPLSRGVRQTLVKVALQLLSKHYR